MRLEVPVLVTLDPAALVLTLGSIVAIFRFGAPTPAVLAVSALAGAAWQMFG